VSLVAGSTVTMSFAGDGKVSGSGGCNTYTSTWRANGNALAFTPAAATRMMCDPGVMAQEQAFFRALVSVATMRMEGDGLELRTNQGALAVIATRTP